MNLSDLKNHDSLFVSQLLNQNNNAKRLFCIALIERQKYLIQLFDQAHKEDLEAIFEYALNLSYSNLLDNCQSKFEIEKLSTIVQEKTPDTDDFGKIEGSYAQNAMISLSYFFNYWQNYDDKEFCYAIEKILESLDVINYEKDENYVESIIFLEEIRIYKILLGIIENKSLDRQLLSQVRMWSNQFIIKP